MPSSEPAPRHSLAARIIAPLLLVVLTLLLAEFALRAWFNLFPPLNHTLLPPGKAGLHLFEPAVGNAFYRVKPNYRQEFLRHEFRTQVRTNNIGLREDSDYHGEPVDIAFIGDSYTFGWGVETGQRYSDVVRSAFPGLRVLSYAYPNGHAPVSYLSFLQQRPELMPRVLVLGLFAFNDLAEDTEDALVTEKEGTIESVASRTLKVDPEGFVVARDYRPPEFPSVDWFTRHTAIGRAVDAAAHRLRSGGGTPPRRSSLRAIDRGQLDETALQALEHIRRIDALARQSGSTLLVFYIPFSADIFDTPVCIYERPLCAGQMQHNALGEALAQWAAAHDIRFIDPVESFRSLAARGEQLYFTWDAHWAPGGHAAAGRLIADYLAASGLVDTAAPARPPVDR